MTTITLTDSHNELSSLALLRSLPPARTVIDAILSNPKAPEIVASFSAGSLYELIEEVGFADAQQLALLATPEQIQGFFDFDAWLGDRFKPERLERWITLYLQLDDEPFAKLFADIDTEMIPLFLKKNLVVYMADEHGQPPENVPGLLSSSPDFTYFIQYPEDPVTEQLCRALLDKIYHTVGVSKGWMMLEATRWEMQSEMEEAAFRFRNLRLEEYGFRSPEEAHALYTRIDLTRLKEEATRLLKDDLPIETGFQANFISRSFAQTLVQSKIFKIGLLGRCLDTLDPLTWQRVQQQLAILGNTTASANKIEPSDRRAIQSAFSESLGYINVGLEFLCGDDLERGSALLHVMPLKRLLRAGHALAGTLQRQAQALIQRSEGLTLVASIPCSLLTEEERTLVQGLLLRRPRRSTEDGGYFLRHAEIEVAAKMMTSILFKDTFFFQILRIDRTELATLAYREDINLGPEQIHFETLLSTLILQQHLTGQLELTPLTPSTLPLDAQKLGEIFDTWRQQNLPAAESIGDFHIIGTNLISRLQRAVTDELAELSHPIDTRFVNALILSTKAD